MVTSNFRSYFRLPTRPYLIKLISKQIFHCVKNPEFIQIHNRFNITGFLRNPIYFIHLKLDSERKAIAFPIELPPKRLRKTFPTRQNALTHKLWGRESREPWGFDATFFTRLQVSLLGSKIHYTPILSARGGYRLNTVLPLARLTGEKMRPFLSLQPPSVLPPNVCVCGGNKQEPGGVASPWENPKGRLAVDR